MANLGSDFLAALAKALGPSTEAVTIADWNGIILWANEQVLRVYRREKESIIGKHPLTFCPPDFTNRFSKKIFDAIHLLGGWDGVVINVDAKGKRFPILLRTVLVKFAGKGYVISWAKPFPQTYGGRSMGMETVSQTVVADSTKTSAPAKKVLILDDVVINLRVLERILRPAGYRVICVTNALDALAATQRENPDLILLDTRFPPDNEDDEPWNSDGICLLEFFHRVQRFKNIPIIIVTADVIPEVKERALAAGALAFVGLPIHHKLILELVRKIIGDAFSPCFPARPPSLATGNHQPAVSSC